MTDTKPEGLSHVENLRLDLLNPQIGQFWFYLPPVKKALNWFLANPDELSCESAQIIRIKLDSAYSDGLLESESLARQLEKLIVTKYPQLQRTESSNSKIAGRNYRLASMLRSSEQ